jgi:hypothetical protein
MNPFDQLMRAKSEMEFFLTLTGAVHGDLRRVWDSGHGSGIKLSVEQNLFRQDGGRKLFERKTTHVFAVFQDGTLTWSILGQPTITGLQNIQGVLEKYRDTLLQTRLPEQTESTL